MNQNPYLHWAKNRPSPRATVPIGYPKSWPQRPTFDREVFRILKFFGIKCKVHSRTPNQIIATLYKD